MEAMNNTSTRVACRHQGQGVSPLAIRIYASTDKFSGPFNVLSRRREKWRRRKMTRSITGAGRPAVGADGELDALLRQFDDQRAVQIGFPGAHDFDYSELAPFFAYLLNNAGDPEVGSSFRSHTKHLEREVVAFLADLFRAPVDDRWGYVTNGGSESNLYALHLGRKLFPDGLVYCSEAAHYSVFKAIDLLALLNKRPKFDLADGADSIAISGHKFTETPFPCSVVVTRRSLRKMVSRPVVYTGSPDTTISGSRSGHAPLLLWQAIRRHGTSGWRIRADRSRELARYAVSRLRELGWEAWRNPHAFTVLLKTPSPQLAQRWMLADGGDGWSHIVCVPGVTHGHIDRFLADLALTEGLPNLPYSFNAPSSPRLLMREER